MTDQAVGAAQGRKPKDAGDGKPSAEPKDVAPVPGSGECLFNDAITVYAGSHHSQYDKLPVRAYAARGEERYPANLFAMLCEDHLTPRTMLASAYASISNPSLVKLVASGGIYWQPAGREKFCFVFENTLGNPLMQDDTRGGMGLKPEAVVNTVIRPVIALFGDMRDRDIVHGNIRVANMFDGGKKDYERVVLGECLSLPASHNQPVLYETIERGMASPSARGTGNQKTDLYSFGVCLAVMMRHFDPMEGFKDGDIIARKIEEGSYAALLGKDRFSGAILELLRGLLHDDEDQRWSLDEVMVWLDGRRLSPKQATRRIKAGRPITFGGEKYVRPELLAQDLFNNVSEARQLSENGELEQWLQRALEDRPTMDRYEKALLQASEGGKGTGYPERLATRMSIALHPEAPLRFRMSNVHPDGIGPALFEAYVQKRDMAVWADFFLNYYITQWLDSQSVTPPDVGGLINKFDSARAYIRQKGLGGGLEKCLYTLDPEAHCLSEKFAKYHVRTPEDMMRALEKISNAPGRPTTFFDRHIVAFLSVKDRKNIDPYLHDLNAAEPYKRVFAEVRALAMIQKRSQMEKFPGISAWAVSNLAPLYERFHDRGLREDIKKRAARLKDQGDLAKIVALFDNPAVYQDDNTRFRRACREYHGYETEAADTTARLQDEAAFGRVTGRKIAAMVAGITSVLIILACLFTSVGKLF